MAAIKIAAIFYQKHIQLLVNHQFLGTYFFTG